MKFLLLFLALIGLGSCDWVQNTFWSRDAELHSHYEAQIAQHRAEEERLRIEAMKRDRHLHDDSEVPPPDGWLTLDFACSGSLRRAQWLVCEHEELGQLHRRLALKWEAAYRSASPERLNVLAAQQNAFIGERNACEDIPCVAAAYHRYLDGDQFEVPKPYYAATVYPAATPWHGERRYGEVSRRRYTHARAGYKYIVERDYGDYHRGHDRFLPGIPASRSCIGEIGFASAQRLSERCDSVTPGLSSLCSIHNSCDGIRVQIDRGCSLTSDKPDYCRHY